VTVATLHRQAVRQLQPAYSDDEARALSYALLSHFAGLSRAHLYASPDTNLPPATADRIQVAVAALLRYKPLQYITGEALFCGFPITVTDDVLIPRPETEELTLWAADSAKQRLSRSTGRRKGGAPFTIVDLCTGSGCIAVALAAMLPAADVYACDRSPAALEIAQRNAIRNGVAVHCFRCDLLAAPAFDRKIDCLIANPPYVRQSEKAQMHPNVLRYEPPEALFVDDDDPLIFYRAIARFAKCHLRAGGTGFVEINEALGGDVKALFTSCRFTNVEVRRDMNGKERMVAFSYPAPPAATSPANRGAL
jgi:release factor glutamine methyltransferase